MYENAQPMGDPGRDDTPGSDNLRKRLRERDGVSNI